MRAPRSGSWPLPCGVRKGALHSSLTCKGSWFVFLLLFGCLFFFFPIRDGTFLKFFSLFFFPHYIIGNYRRFFFFSCLNCVRFFISIFCFSFRFWAHLSSPWWNYRKIRL